MVWGTKPVVLIVVDVLWHGVVPACAAYLPRIPENTCATVRRVRDTRLQEHCLAQVQNLLHYHHISGDDQVNRSNDNWDNLWDELADQYLLCKISVGSMSSYLWIAA